MDYEHSQSILIKSHQYRWHIKPNS